MIQRVPWFERIFTFAFPPGFYPEVIERLRGTPARLEDRVQGLPVDVLTRRDGDHWSIQENAGHLFDLEALMEGRLEDFLAGVDVLRAADLTNQVTATAGHNRRPIADILAAFRARRLGNVARLESLDSDLFARTALHPRLQVPMRLIDLLEFQANHDDFHLATISEMLRQHAGTP